MPERPLLSVVPHEPDPAPLQRRGHGGAVVEQSAPGAVVPGGRGPPPRFEPPTRANVGGMLVRLLVVVVVSGLGALALGPRLVRSDLPTDAALLGTAARAVVVADRDYALIDTTATDEQRDASSAAALPIWDLDDVRARRDAQVVQKAVVRVAVALEPLRRGDEDDVDPDVPAGKAELDAVRAVVAGELAAVGFEAPRDDQWRALLTVLWKAPGAADALGAVVGAAFSDPILNTPAGGPLDDADQLRVRGVGSREEQIVAVDDIVTVDGARRRFEDRLQAAVVDVAPPKAGGAWTSSMRVLAGWLGSLVVPNLTWNAAETEARRRLAADRVPPTIVRAWRGEVVLRPGELITARHQLLARAMAVQQAGELRTRATVGTAFFVALVCSVIYLFGARRVFQRRLRTRDILFIGVLLAIELGLLVVADVATPFAVGRISGLQPAMIAFALPVAFGPMCLRLTLPPDVAMLFALVVALLGGVVVEGGMQWAVVATLSSMTGVAVVTGGPRRWTVLLAGLAAGLVGVFAALTLELFRGALAGRELTTLLLAVFVGGLGSGVVAVVLVPVVERLFGYVTDQRLYRLADLNNPLLKDLIVHAPGTWHHSVRVAVLAEQAAAAVDANVLLARVMSLYHDIGKIQQPRSFRENQQGDNPHDRLAPDESAAILRGHVDEGLALAREHHLPLDVAAVIEEHHADSVMETFLQKARARADGNDVDEAGFRYTGRPPSTKESALVMLADQIESAARQLDESSPQRLDAVVDHFVNRALTTDLLASCDLTLKELERARAALKSALAGLNRSRAAGIAGSGGLAGNVSEVPRRGES
ncbi:MAG TPA: HDIG domain-containing protein [Myxococcota bacterium]